MNKNDGAIFVKKVKDPSQYGVVQHTKKGIITNFIEKPQRPISKLAIIGVYFLKESGKLLKEIEQIISNRILEKNEYQLTTALKKLCEKGQKFQTIEVQDWLDCGNPKQLLITNKYLLKNKKFNQSNTQMITEGAKIKIIQPVYIGKNVLIKNSTIGPNVSIEDDVIIKNSKIKNTIIQNQTIIKNTSFVNSIIGNNVVYEKTAGGVLHA